jgi:hypothetical protein
LGHDAASDARDVSALLGTVFRIGAQRRSFFIAAIELLTQLTGPVESLAGFLRVLPGQVSVLRWNGLSARISDETSLTPIDVYLRGWHVEDAVKKVLYLAEDRIVGAEVSFANSGDWRPAFRHSHAVVLQYFIGLREILAPAHIFELLAVYWTHLPAVLNSHPTASVRLLAGIAGVEIVCGMQTSNFLILLVRRKRISLRASIARRFPASSMVG